VLGGEVYDRVRTKVVERLGIVEQRFCRADQLLVAAVTEAARTNRLFDRTEQSIEQTGDAVMRAVSEGCDLEQDLEQSIEAISLKADLIEQKECM
jgi:hypothetical protein